MLKTGRQALPDAWGGNRAFWDVLRGTEPAGTCQLARHDTYCGVARKEQGFV